MNQLIQVFKPAPAVMYVFRAVALMGVFIALTGFLHHEALICCVGFGLLTIFAGLSFRQSSQTILIYDDRVVFLYAGRDAWTIPFNSFNKLELSTSYKNVSKYSPGRTILLRFLDWDDKLCAEANVNVFDNNAIRSMIAIIQSGKPELSLNRQAHELLQIGTRKDTTIGAVTKME